MSSLNLQVPTVWQQLSDKQLRFVFKLIAADFSIYQLQTLCLLKWARLKVVRREGQIFIVRHDGKNYSLSANQIYEATTSLNFLGDIPKYPVRLSRIGIHHAIRADIQDLPFSDYLSLDNLYQGYLQTRNKDLLEKMACTLYKTKHIRLSAPEALSVFYWFAAVKQMFANMFTHLFKTASPDAQYSSPTFKQLQDAMNAQIRALTNGDITKENAVLEMDTWRALTELNAKARDYEEIKAARHS